MTAIWVSTANSLQFLSGGCCSLTNPVACATSGVPYTSYACCHALYPICLNVGGVVQCSNVAGETMPASFGTKAMPANETKAE